MKVKSPFAPRMLLLTLAVPRALGTGSAPALCLWTPMDAWWSQKAVILLDPVSVKDFIGITLGVLKSSGGGGGVH